MGSALSFPKKNNSGMNASQMTQSAPSMNVARPMIQAPSMNAPRPMNVSSTPVVGGKRSKKSRGKKAKKGKKTRGRKN